MNNIFSLNDDGSQFSPITVKLPLSQTGSSLALTNLSPFARCTLGLSRSFLARGNSSADYLCSLGPDQERHSVHPDLDPNCLTLW